MKLVAPGSLEVGANAAVPMSEMQGADEGGELGVGGESMGSDTTGAEAGMDLMEGGTRAAGIHSVLFRNSMWPNTQSINRL